MLIMKMLDIMPNGKDFIVISLFILALSVYVDASELCNDLTMNLGPTSTTELTNAGLTTGATRSWNIKVHK